MEPWPSFLTSACRWQGWLLALALPCGSLSAETANASKAPISLNAALRMSIEDSQRFLEQMPGWLASEYAKTDPLWQQEMLLRAGRAAWLLSKPSEQLQFADQLEALSAGAKLPKAQAYALIVRARHRQELGDYRNSVDLVAQAATLLASLQSPEAQALAELEFCAAYYSSEQIELALRACERAEKIFASLPALPEDPDTWSYAQSERVLNHANTKNFYFIAAETRQRDPTDLARAQEAIALFTALKTPTMVSMVQDNLSGYYLDQGDSAKALSLSQASLKLELTQGRIAHAVSSLMNIARAQSRMGQHTQALDSIEQALAHAKRIEQNSLFASVYELQMELAQAAGNLPLAITAAEAAIAANNLAFDQRNSRAIAEMDARFQGAEQSREIERLAQERKIRLLELEASKAENAKQAAQLSRKNLWLWLVTVSTVGLFLVAALFGLLWRASKRYAQKMHWLAQTDGLTQLLNRRAFVEQFSRSLQELAQTDTSGALCIIDIDHFKQINDAHGHPVGDSALKHIAGLIRHSSSTGANATDHDNLLIGRLGGEEFAVWLPHVGADDALAFAERLRLRIANDHQDSKALGFPMSISVGIAAFSTDQLRTVAQWLSTADRALYRAKNLGRNRCEMATAEGEMTSAIGPSFA